MFTEAKIVASLMLRKVTRIYLKDRYPQWEIGPGSYGRISILKFGNDGQLFIGAYCSFANGVQILLGGEHRADWVTTYPFARMNHRLRGVIQGDPKSKGDVRIGNDVWVGREAMLLSGVTVGDGAVIGARSVVSKDVPPYAIVSGNPATIRRTRFPPDQIERLLAIQWWNWPKTRLDAAMPLLLKDDIEAFLIDAERYSMATDA